jgi:dienelactone hydrolase
MKLASAFTAQVFACALLAITAGAAHAQAVVTDFSKGQPNGKYSFASATPKTLPDLIKGVGLDQTVNITGHLFLPKGKDGDKVPAVVLMHGSGGIYNAMLTYWPKTFNDAGIAVFAVDSFGPRGVKSTAEDQSQVPFAADLVDTFAALKLLASHPRIDPKRIAVMGFSRGGTTAWRADVERIVASQKLPENLRFAAHVPVYSGGCTGSLRIKVKENTFGKAPILFIHGEADDYTPIKPCREFADEIGKTGTPVEFVAIKGAYHKFDQDDQKLVFGKALLRAVPDCPIEIDIDNFYAYDRSNGQRLQGEAYQAMAKKCVTTGASVGGNAAARDQAAKAAVAFLKKVFAL